MPTPNDPPTRRQGLVIGGAILTLIGLAIGVAGLVTGFGPLFRLSITDAVPGEPTAFDAEAGQAFAIYRSPGAGEASCRSFGPDGEPVSLSHPFGTETIDLRGREYVVEATFTAATGGAHTIECSASGYGVGPRVPVVGVIGRVLVGALIGGTLIAVGVVMLAIEFARPRPPSGARGSAAGEHGD